MIGRQNMKTLKWLWMLVLLTIGFKLIGWTIWFVGVVNGDYSDSSTYDYEPFFGMVFIFAFLSVALIVFWIIGRVKEKIIGL